MAFLSYLLGQKHFPVPYDLKRLLGYPLLAVALYAGLLRIDGLGPAGELAARNGVLAAFLAMVFLLERRRRSSNG
jgi:hypothetical protein